MTRLLDLADCPACDNCGHPDYCHGKWAWWKLWRRGTTWCDHQWKAKTCTCQHWAPF